MNEEVRDLIGSEPLLGVTGRDVGNGQLVALALVFGADALHCRCNDATDEIVIEVVSADSLDYPPLHNETLQRAIGMVLEYAWDLTNHRGYADAFQLRFADSRGQEEMCQFEVAACTIDIYRVL